MFKNLIQYLKNTIQYEPSIEGITENVVVDPQNPSSRETEKVVDPISPEFIKNLLKQQNVNKSDDSSLSFNPLSIDLQNPVNHPRLIEHLRNNAQPKHSPESVLKSEPNTIYREYHKTKFKTPHPNTEVYFPEIDETHKPHYNVKYPFGDKEFHNKQHQLDAPPHDFINNYVNKKNDEWLKTDFDKLKTHFSYFSSLWDPEHADDLRKHLIELNHVNEKDPLITIKNLVNASIHLHDNKEYNKESYKNSKNILNDILDTRNTQHAVPTWVYYVQDPLGIRYFATPNKNTIKYSKQLIDSILKHPGIGQDIKDNFFEKYISNYPLSKDAVEAISYHPNEKARATLAHRQDIPNHILDRLATDSNNVVKRSVLNNEKLSPNSLELLANEEDPTIKQKVVIHPNTKSSTLSKLFDELYDSTIPHIKSSVNFAIANHKNAPVDALISLHDHTIPEIRQRVASNLRTPSAILKKMARTDTDFDVLRILTRNPNSDSTVRGYLLQRAQNFEKTGNSTKASSLKIALLQQYSDDYRVSRLKNVYGIPSKLEPELLQDLLKDSKYHPSLADHRQTPPEVLHNLANSDNQATILNVIANPNTTQHTLRKLLKKHQENRAFRGSIQTRLSKMRSTPE